MLTIFWKALEKVGSFCGVSPLCRNRVGEQEPEAARISFAGITRIRYQSMISAVARATAPLTDVQI
jgi:hypothetical protein